MLYLAEADSLRQPESPSKKKHRTQVVMKGPEIEVTFQQLGIVQASRNALVRSPAQQPTPPPT